MSEERGLPANVSVFFRGTRTGIQIDGTANVLTPDGKLDRSVVLRVGRLPDDFAFYEIVADTKPVARLTRSEKTWKLALFDEKGAERKTQEFDRSKTTRPSRKGGIKDSRIDPGTDLLTAVSVALGMVYPDMKSSGRGSGAKKQKLSEQLDAVNEQLYTLVKQVAGMTGKSIEEIAEQYGLNLSPSAKKEANKSDEKAQTNKPPANKSGKNK